MEKESFEFQTITKQLLLSRFIKIKIKVLKDNY